MNKIDFVDVDVHPNGLVFVAVRRGEEYHTYGSYRSERSKSILKRGIQLLQLLKASLEKSSSAA